MEIASNDYRVRLDSLLRELEDSDQRSPIMERKSFIKSLIKEARVKDAEVSLIYTISITPRKVTSEELAVLPIVHYGGAEGAIGRTFSLTFRLTN